MRTPLYEEHLALKARVVDFHGWDMPVQYSGIVAEHAAVRTKVGLFDLSHMGRVWVSGPARLAYLNRILTVNVERMAQGRCRYTFYLNPKGGIIDDLLVYEDKERDRSLLVVNASNREKDIAWMRRQAENEEIKIDDQTLSTALIALQGPQSLDSIRRVMSVDPGSLAYYTFGIFDGILISRTGYTGEDGFEIFIPADSSRAIWKKFIDAGLAPVGLGARDTLRTEAGMPLYGNDIDETSTPLEAGLDFAVQIDTDRDFIGRSALKKQRKSGLERMLVGFQMRSKRIARHGYDVFRGNECIGTVTSGTFSPTLDKGIGMAYVDVGYAGPGTELTVDVRGKREEIEIVTLPFYQRPRKSEKAPA